MPAQQNTKSDTRNETLKLIKTTGNFDVEVMRAFQEVDQEVATAMDRFPAMHSPHEGYAIILEELEELFEVVRQKNKTRDGKGGQDIDSMRKEAKQVAAMAIMFMVDICA